MLLRIVRLPVQPSQLKNFMLHFNASKEKIRSFEGCSQLKLMCDVQHKNILYTYSYWDSEEHLEKYLESTLFKETWALVKSLFFEKPRAWSLNEIMTVEAASKS